MSNERRVFFSKGIHLGLLALTVTDQGTLIGSFNSRQMPPIKKHFALFGAEEARSFDGQIAQTVEHGWQLNGEFKPNNPFSS